MIEPRSHTFGEVSQQEKLKKNFLLTNRSNSSIELTRVHVACSCTVPAIQKKRLLPGDSTVLEVAWNVGSSRGNISTEIEISYKKPGVETSFLEKLVLYAKANPDFEYSPSRLKFVSSDVQEAEVEFSPANMESLSLKNAYCTHSAFEAQIGENINGKSKVLVKFNPEKWYSDSLSAQLIVVSNSEGEPRTSIPLIVSNVKPNQE